MAMTADTTQAIEAGGGSDATHIAGSLEAPSGTSAAGRQARPKIRKLAIIGGGKMGGTFATRVVETGLVSADRVVVSDPDAAVRARLEARAGAVDTMFDHANAIKEASTVLLAVTPQVIPGVMDALRGQLQLNQLVVSIAAGVELQTLQMGLRHSAIIRVMPNTPAQVGHGISAWIATEEVTEAQRAEAQAILQSIGREFEVDRERYLDMVTAMSGSGPAWVMIMLESMIDAGVQIGLKPDWAKELALQTMSGSVELARQTGKHPAELRNMVTTPAGTTAAGLYAMEKGGLRAAIIGGIVAAYERSLELGAAARK
jgi:pyrroline-5-carboxylate reductase